MTLKTLNTTILILIIKKQYQIDLLDLVAASTEPAGEDLVSTSLFDAYPEPVPSIL